MNFFTDYIMVNHHHCFSTFWENIWFHFFQASNKQNPRICWGHLPSMIFGWFLKHHPGFFFVGRKKTKANLDFWAAPWKIGEPQIDSIWFTGIQEVSQKQTDSNRTSGFPIISLPKTSRKFGCCWLDQSLFAMHFFYLFKKRQVKFWKKSRGHSKDVVR